MTLEKEQLFFLISDAVGDTARQVTHAALAQYTGRLKAKIRRQLDKRIRTNFKRC